MQLVLHLVNSMFDFLFWPFRSVSRVYSLLFFSLLTGMLMVLAFRYISDQDAIRRAKDRVQAHILAVRLFRDQVEVVLRSYAALVRGTLAYILYSLVPLAVLAIPVAVVLSQMQMRIGWVSPRPGQSFLLTACVARGIALDEVSLQLPKGLRVSAPSVRIPATKEISWRIVAERFGVFHAQVSVAGQNLGKQIALKSDVAALPIARVRGSIRQGMLYPGEAPLPAGGPLEAIELKYQPAVFEVGDYRIDWWVLFSVFSLVFALAVKPLMRAEF